MPEGTRGLPEERALEQGLGGCVGVCQIGRERSKSVQSSRCGTSGVTQGASGLWAGVGRSLYWGCECLVFITQ